MMGKFSDVYFPTQTEIKKRKYNKENMGKYSIWRYIIL